MPRPASLPDITWRELPVRGFVPVEAEPRSPAPETVPVLEAPLAAVDADAWAGRVSLFGDPER